MRPVVLFGAGGHARVVADIIEKQGVFRIAAVVSRDGGALLDYPVRTALGDLDIMEGVVAIGDNWVRSQVVARVLAERPDFRFVTPVHPSAQIGRDVVLGPGTVVMAGVCINPGTRVGAHCIINTRASVDHDNVLDDFASVAPGVTTGGDVRVGPYSAVGIGAACVHGRAIGEHTVIGAGAVVCADVPDHVVAYGVPCRVIRPRSPGDRYM